MLMPGDADGDAAAAGAGGESSGELWMKREGRRTAPLATRSLRRRAGAAAAACAGSAAATRAGAAAAAMTPRIRSCVFGGGRYALPHTP